MTAVHLKRSFISDATNHTSRVIVGTASRSEEDSLNGAVEEYANGVLRAKRTRHNPRDIKLTARHISPAEVEWLRQHKGDTVLFRDIHGRKMYGVYYKLVITDYRGEPPAHDVAFVIQRVTHSDEVL